MSPTVLHVCVCVTIVCIFLGFVWLRAIGVSVCPPIQMFVRGRWGHGLFRIENCWHGRLMFSVRATMQKTSPYNVLCSCPCDMTKRTDCIRHMDVAVLARPASLPVCLPWRDRFQKHPYWRPRQILPLFEGLRTQSQQAPFRQDFPVILVQTTMEAYIRTTNALGFKTIKFVHTKFNARSFRFFTEGSPPPINQWCHDSRSET